MNFILAMLGAIALIFFPFYGIYFAFPNIFKNYYVDKRFSYYGNRLVIKVAIWRYGSIAYSKEYDFQGVSFTEAMKKVDEETNEKLEFIKTLP